MMEPAELPTWATEETAAPVEPVIIHAAPGEKDAAIAAASQSATEDSPKRSWLWAATLATWGLITQVARWWWNLAKEKPVAGAIMLIIVIIAIAVLCFFLSTLFLIVFIIGSIVAVAAGITYLQQRCHTTS